MNDDDPSSLLTLGFSLTLLGITVFFLRQIDNAAKKRGAPFGIFLVDLFSLSFMIAIPLAIVTSNGVEFDDRVAPLLTIIGIPTMALVWWTTIRTVSKAGINNSVWRAGVSLIVIPMCYVGNIVIGVLTAGILHGEINDTRMIALDGLLIALTIASGFIVFGALKNAKRSAARPTEPDNSGPIA